MDRRDTLSIERMMPALSLCLFMLFLWTPQKGQPPTTPNPEKQNGGENGTVIHGTAGKGETFPKKLYALSALGNGEAGDGTVLAIKWYVNSDGVKVQTIHGRFKSATAAQQELQHRVAAAERVVEQLPRKNVFGAVIGKRAVVWFPATDSMPRRASILLTDGVNYYEISSSSLEAAKDMAQRYYGN